MLKIGDSAPNFNLQDDSGAHVSLNDFKGKTVVVYFYPKDDTPGCTVESCDFRDRNKVFKRKNIVILGVSADSVESHVKFKSKYKLTFPLLSDSDKKMIKDYGIWKKKILYGKSYMGIERTTFVINPKGKISKIFPKVKVDGHIQAVLDSLA